MKSTHPRYGKYLLVLSGLAQDAPFLEGWRALKDSIRQNASRPGWTDVISTPHEGIQRGWCNFRRVDDAEAAYSMRNSIQRDVSY